jgi:hypothetical protein
MIDNQAWNSGGLMDSGLERSARTRVETRVQVKPGNRWNRMTTG